jgi:hypothetical protein
MNRCKTDYPGIFYQEARRIGDNEPERIYYIVFKPGGKVFEEKAGPQYADDMTAACNFVTGHCWPFSPFAWHCPYRLKVFGFIKNLSVVNALCLNSNKF